MKQTLSKSISSLWSKVDVQDGPNHCPARYDETCVRSKASGSSRSFATSTMSPVAMSIGSDLQTRSSGPTARSRGGLGLFGEPDGVVEPSGFGFGGGSALGGGAL